MHSKKSTEQRHRLNSLSILKMLIFWLIKIILNKINNPEVIHASSLIILELHTYFLQKNKFSFPFITELSYYSHSIYYRIRLEKKSVSQLLLFQFWQILEWHMMVATMPSKMSLSTSWQVPWVPQPPYMLANQWTRSKSKCKLILNSILPWQNVSGNFK